MHDAASNFIISKRSLVKFLEIQATLHHGSVFLRAAHQCNRKIQACHHVWGNLLLGMNLMYYLHLCMFPYKYSESYVL